MRKRHNGGKCEKRAREWPSDKVKHDKDEKIGNHGRGEERKNKF